MIEGAKPSEMPGFIPPNSHAQAQGAGGKQVDSRNQMRWLPVQVHLNKGKVKIFTRNGHD